MRLEPGTRVDRYEVDHLIGEGGMATVYAVRHRVLGTHHALKVLTSGVRALADRLVREGQAQAALHHPNVVPVSDVLDLDGAPALLMPLIQGPTLASAIARRQPTLPEALALFRSVAAGVAHAHALGMIHRDLKPANVLLDLAGASVRACVADFGLVKVLDSADSSSTRFGSFVGTARYAAPEQLRDASSADARADVWSLGCILFELLVGTPPVIDPHASDLVSRAWRADWPDPRPRLADMPPPLVSLVASLLEPDREARPSTGGAVVEALDALALGVDPLPVDGEFGRACAAMMPESASTGRWAQPTGSGITFAPDVRLHNVGPERDDFVGREAELERLEQVFFEAGRRLVSVVGPGGAGKTRLSRRFVMLAGHRWASGAWFCALDQAWDVAGVAHSVANALGVPVPDHDAVDTVGRALAARGKCLLVLDNFEQIVAHGPSTVGRWLDLAPELSVLVTSRERLRIQGETLLPLHPLPVPDDASDLAALAANPAVRLFVQRASAMAPGLVLDADTAAPIARIVQLVDGLPLALELAAARARYSSVTSLSARLGERLDVLVTSTRDVPARQATIRAAIDWSWSLLDANERDLLARLSVFAGWFDAGDATAVWDGAAAVVEDLVDKSLVCAVPDADRRFTLLSTVRAFARERLAEREADAADAASRHAARMAEIGRGKGEVKGRVADLERAVEVALDARQPATAAGAALGVGRALAKTGPHHALVELTGAVLQLDLAPADRQAMLQVRGGAWLAAGWAAEATASFEEARAVATERRDAPGIARTTERLAHCLARRGNAAEALELAAEALRAARSLGDGPTEMSALWCMGDVHGAAGRYSAARACFEDAVAVGRQRGPAPLLGSVLTHLGHVHWDFGELDEARASYTEALDIQRRAGAPHSEAVSLGALGGVDTEQGRLPSARERLEAAIRLSRHTGARGNEADWLVLLGDLSIEEGRIEDAHGLFEAAMEIHTALQRPAGVARATLGRGRAALEAGALDQAEVWLEAGRAGLARAGALTEAGKGLSAQGDLWLARGALDLAEAVLADADAALSSPRAALDVPLLLARWARLYARRGARRQAISALGEAEHLASSLGLGRPTLQRRLRALRAELAPSSP